MTMTDIFDSQSETEQQLWLERLVDGELQPNQQRQLVLWLESQPDGWRRCALAFLESQSLGQELSRLTGSDRAVPTMQSGGSHSASAAAQFNSTSKVRWLQHIAVAAAVLLAFTLGMAVHRPTSSDPVDQPTLAGQSTAETSISLPEKQIAAQQLLQVTLPSADGQAAETIELPLIEADETAIASLLDNQQPVLSEVERKTLERTGHRVEQVRAYYPVQLTDGRQAVLPMDLVEVEYTGGWQ